MWLSWFGGLGLGFLALFLSLVLIYNWGCLFVKRLRGAGKSGWLFLPILIAFIVISYFVASVLTAAMNPEILKEGLALQETVNVNNPDLQVVLPFYERFFKAIAVPYAAAYLGVGAVLAFTINAKLPVGLNPDPR